MEKKEWSFGTLQLKVKAENGQLSYRHFGQGASYPLNAVAGVQYDTELLTANLIVLASGGKNEKTGIPKSEKSKQIIQDINSYIESFKKRSQPTPQQASNNLDKSLIADELMKLAELNKIGVLTNEEFATQKAKLLNS